MLFFIIFALLTTFIVALVVVLMIRRDHKTVVTTDVPREFLNDEESLYHLTREFDYHQLSPPEQQSYLEGQQFQQEHPPQFTSRGQAITPEIYNDIKDRGIMAFSFDQDQPQAGYRDDVGETARLLPRYIVQDRTEIKFIYNHPPYSTATAVLNYPLPVRNRTMSDCIYFETKIFEFTPSANAHFAIGLVTRPYPPERLPGYNQFLISYESTGNLKINKPFPTPTQQHRGAHSVYNAQVLPPVLPADVIGFGYHVVTGTIFITRNGKKLLDVTRGVFVDLYPAVGCFSSNGTFHVNLGQLGFVWIEANVKKYGFVSTSDYRRMAGDRATALPLYGGTDEDKVLERGEALPPRYPVEELDFFGRRAGRHAGEQEAAEEDGEKSSRWSEDEEVRPVAVEAYEAAVSAGGTESIVGTESVVSSMASAAAALEGESGDQRER